MRPSATSWNKLRLPTACCSSSPVSERLALDPWSADHAVWRAIDRVSGSFWQTLAPASSVAKFEFEFKFDSDSDSEPRRHTACIAQMRKLQVRQHGV